MGPAGLAHAPRRVRIAEHARQRLGEGRRRRRGQPARAAVDDRLGGAAPVDGDHRARGRHRLQRDDAEVLGQRRVDDAGRARQQRAALGVAR